MRVPSLGKVAFDREEMEMRRKQVKLDGNSNRFMAVPLRMCLETIVWECIIDGTEENELSLR